MDTNVHSNQILGFTAGPFFIKFSPEEKKELLQKSKKAHYEKGEIIFEQDEIGELMYFIDNGEVVLERLDSDGKELELTTLESGDFFGEMSLFDNQGRSCRASAGSETDLSIISKETFYKLLLEHPDLSIKIITTLCQRLRETDKKLEELAFVRVKERLKKILSDSSGNKRVIKLSLTHQELASKVGACRETVTRTLKELQDEGWKFEKERK